MTYRFRSQYLLVTRVCAVIAPADVLAELRRLSPYDPEHLPAEINMIEAFSPRQATWPQIADLEDSSLNALPPSQESLWILS